MVAVIERSLVVGEIGKSLEWGVIEKERVPKNEFWELREEREREGHELHEVGIRIDGIWRCNLEREWVLAAIDAEEKNGEHERECEFRKTMG